MVPSLATITMFLQAIDVPDTDLLHHFERTRLSKVESLYSDMY